MNCEENLFERLCDLGNLEAGLRAVKKNGGSAGVDGMSIDDFQGRSSEELLQLQKEIATWQYVPKAVRRVEIPKPQGGTRQLGVPCIRDRVVQATIKLLLEPILEPLFSAGSYGFRPGRNQKQAVEAARSIIEKGKPYVVDIDLSKFFDRINHDRLIARLGKVTTDKRILRLIGMTLRSGAMANGVVTPTYEGSTQGSPLSPLLSNFVLDELDKELERRGLEFCRFADDCNIFASSKEEADEVMKEISDFIESKLKLRVNWEKSKVARNDEVKFLGMTVDRRNKIAISNAAMSKAIEKTKTLTRRRTHLPFEKSLEQINRWYVGWSNYYGMTAYPNQLNHIEGHIRRRLRARFVTQQKRKRYLLKKLVQRGVSRQTASKAVYSNKGTWALSRTNALERAYPNLWFQIMGFKSIATETRPHWENIHKQPAMA